MAVSFDSKFEKGASSVSSLSFVSNAGTVTGSVAANSNRVLIATLSMWGTGIVGAISAPAITWNSVSMTLIGTMSNATDNMLIYVFGLKNPDTGANTIAATWTGGAVTSVVLGATSLYDADQTTGWQNFTSTGATGTAVSLGVTSANGNMACVFLTDTNASSATITAGTSDWNERTLDRNFNAGHLASTGSTTTLSWTLGTSVAWNAAGVDVIASGASALILPYGMQLRRQLKAQKRRRPV